MEHAVYKNARDKKVVLELEDYTEKAVYLGDTSACTIKVYDASKDELSEYVLNQMAATAVSEDERQELFITELTDLLARIKQVQIITGDDISEMLEMLTGIQEHLPEKNVVNLAGRKEITLTQQQMNQQTQIGYAFAFITLGFLFCGVCAAHSVIEEQNNKVFTRVMLTKLSSKDYFLSKFVAVFLISVLQTLVLAVCLSLMRGLDVGMDILSFLVVILIANRLFITEGTVKNYITSILAKEYLSHRTALAVYYLTGKKQS